MPSAAQRAKKVKPVVTHASQRIKFAKRIMVVPVGQKNLALNFATQTNHTPVETLAFPSAKSATNRMALLAGKTKLT